MHHSRLSSVIIDCRTPDVTSAAKFWSEALGRPVAPNASNPSYVSLQMQPGEIICQVQSVTHGSRVHLDIETDDIVFSLRGERPVDSHTAALAWPARPGSVRAADLPTSAKAAIGQAQRAGLRPRNERSLRP
jgi:hypothetical protein